MVSEWPAWYRGRMLTDAKIRAAKPRERPYRIGDSGQLYLQITPAGGRLWRMNYSFGRNESGKPLQKTLSFGAYPAVSLADARGRRDEAKRLLAKGLDPAVVWRNEAAQQATVREPSFQDVAEMWFEHNSGWSLERLKAHAAASKGKWSKKHASDWIVDNGAFWSTVHSADVWSSLERDILPAIGKRAIRGIAPLDVRDTLQKVEARGSVETAHRLRQRVSAVFQWGMNCGLCDSDPAVSIGATLKPIPPSRHQPAIVDEYGDEPARIAAIQQMLNACDALPGRAQNKLALRFMALTAVRSSELAGARWDEFVDLDGENPTWIIPAARMKGVKARRDDVRFDHMVPLARQSVAILSVLKRLTGRFELCFPSERHSHRRISENTLRAVLIRAGYFQRHVPHGFRACFSTIMNERADILNRPGDRLVIDMMLAHSLQEGDKSSPSKDRLRVSSVERAYNRAAYMTRRRELAQEWADLITTSLCEPSFLIGRPIR